MHTLGIMKDVVNCVQGNTPGRLPVFPFTDAFDPRACGMSWEEYVIDAKKMVQCEIAMVKRFDYDWIFFPMDEVVVLEPLGIEAGPKLGGKGTVPWIPSTSLPAEDSTLKNLRMPNPQKDGRMPLRLETISKAKAEFGDSVCVTGYVEGPFTCACYLYSATVAMPLLLDRPKFIMDTVEFFTELQIRYGKAQIEAGAHAVFISDLFAASNFISVEHYNQFALEPVKKLIREYDNAGAIVFYHPNEHRIAHLTAMTHLRESGSVALTIGDRGDIFEAKKIIGDKICLMGGIDPLGVFRTGTPESIDKATKIIVENVSKKGGHILSTGAMVAVDTPEQNMMAMIRAARKYWTEKAV